MIRQFYQFVVYRLTYAIALFLAIIGKQAPTLLIARQIATGIFALLFIPCTIKLFITFLKLVPLGSLVYRNHPQWGARNRNY